MLPQGANRVFTGEEDRAGGFATHPRGAVFRAPREIAEGLEARGLVEIQG